LAAAQPENLDLRETRLDAIVTRNRKDFAGSPVPVLTPAKLLALLARTPEA
jgi:hypothetical protein